MGRRGKGLAIRLLSYAKAKKMKSLTLHTNGNPSARLRECSPSTKYLPYFAIHRALLFYITFDHTLNTTRDIVLKKCRGGGVESREGFSLILGVRLRIFIL